MFNRLNTNTSPSIPLFPNFYVFTFHSFLSFLKCVTKKFFQDENVRLPLKILIHREIADWYDIHTVQPFGTKQCGFCSSMTWFCSIKDNSAACINIGFLIVFFASVDGRAPLLPHPVIPMWWWGQRSTEGLKFHCCCCLFYLSRSLMQKVSYKCPIYIHGISAGFCSDIHSYYTGHTDTTLWGNGDSRPQLVEGSQGNWKNQQLRGNSVAQEKVQV